MDIDRVKLDVIIAKTGLTLKEVAKRTQINEVTLCRIRKGKQEPSLRTLGRIAKALDVEIAEIIKD